MWCRVYRCGVESTKVWSRVYNNSFSHPPHAPKAFTSSTHHLHHTVCDPDMCGIAVVRVWRFGVVTFLVTKSPLFSTVPKSVTTLAPKSVTKQKRARKKPNGFKARLHTTAWHNASNEGKVSGHGGQRRMEVPVFYVRQQARLHYDSCVMAYDSGVAPHDISVTPTKKPRHLCHTPVRCNRCAMPSWQTRTFFVPSWQSATISCQFGNTASPMPAKMSRQQPCHVNLSRQDPCLPI